MAQKGFSGRTEYEKKPRTGKSGKPAGAQEKSAYGYGGKSGGTQEKGAYGGYTKGKPSANPAGRAPYGKKPALPRDDRRPTEHRAPKPAQENTEALPQEQQDELPFLIIGRNAVREAVKAGRSLDRILVSREPDGSLREIVNMARDKNYVLREVDKKKLDELCMPFGHGGKTANHQGVVAYAAGVEYCAVSDILALAKKKGEAPFVIVLDGVEDPHNLGSIVRSAECAGAHGVIIGKRRAAAMSAAAMKAAAGAAEYIRIARVPNISGALIELKKAGCWIAGADMSGVSMEKQGLNGALALVIGSEGDGLTRLVRDNCDFLVSIPMRGRIDSLNASVAAAVLMFEKRRQDGNA